MKRRLWQSIILSAILVLAADIDGLFTPTYPHSFLAVALQTLGILPLAPGITLLGHIASFDGWPQSLRLISVSLVSLFPDAVLIWVGLSVTSALTKRPQTSAAKAVQ